MDYKENNMIMYQCNNPKCGWYTDSSYEGEECPCGHGSMHAVDSEELKPFIEYAEDEQSQGWLDDESIHAWLDDSF